MAAPRHRRRGFSRRVQYSLFAGYVLAVVGVMVAVALLAIAHLDPRAFATLRGVAIDAGSLISGPPRAIVRGAADISAEIDAYFDAAAQNRALKRRLEASERARIGAQALALENARLKRMALLVEHLPRPLLSARIVGSTPTAARRFVTLAAGSSDGVRPGMAVRAPEGLIGRVFETGMIASRVLLLTDGESAVPVRMARNGVAALVTGRGDGSVEIRGLIAGGRPFRRGDLALTSGVGGVYTPNVPVAVVVSVTGDRAVALPLADPARIGMALVYPIYQAPSDAAPSQPKP
ncbi:rod shape-determining protein MreC [Sphingomonas crocodyli]|uniref:Cell shape-determining protein MreC n=1 Tax=Sphingomonas crocodyli TaxID=1979270 RepID=A0A437M9H5_9SPHN|nr:rod shape-determining protein MreC [Sphingomonas crocodyli]RVT94237.1 rod shape-determining protein MreC [Sphingomonas crocodyli]